MVKYFFVAFAICFLSGCAHVNIDYVEPSSDLIAEVTITHLNMDYQKNMVINYKGNELCDPKKVKLMGILNAKIIGYENRNLKEFTSKVTAGKEISISSPQFHVGGITQSIATIYTCEPLLAFTPENGQRYLVEFKPCSGTVYRITDAGRAIEPTSRLDKSCKVVSNNQGTDGHATYLVPR